MLRRLLPLAALLFAACAAESYYAVFPPAVPGDEAQRTAGDGFSLVLPQHFESQSTGGSGAFRFRETPPPNGQNRLFRVISVEPVAAATDDDPAAIAEQGLALLRAHWAADDLEVRETGSAKLADRDCPLLVGRVRGPAAGWFFDLLAYYVPGDPHGLVVWFQIPEGQLAASREAFAKCAASLQTTLGMPKPGPAGPMRWHDEHHLGLRLPADWTVLPDAPGSLAAYSSADGNVRCDLVRETVTAPDLDAVQRGYERERGANFRDLAIVGTQWRQLAGQRALRVVSAYRDVGDTLVVDDLLLLRGTTLYRVVFRAAQADFGAARPAIERAIASARVE